MPEKAALLIVDVQSDFCPGGALQITDGDRVVEPILEKAGAHLTTVEELQNGKHLKLPEQ